MNASAIIQARMGSTRLPGKVMMNVNSKNPILYYVIKQLQYCRFLDRIIIATTTLKEDDEITNFAQKMKVSCFRGNSKDVLDRYYKCAKKFSVSTIVRITADNPLIDPLIVDRVVRKFDSRKYDYVTNCHPRTFPYGTETEVFSFVALEEVWKNAKKSTEREHVTLYFYNKINKFRTFNVEHSEDISYLRWTVDRKDDLKLIQYIVSKIKKRPILMTDIINLFKKEPSLVDINKDRCKD